MAGRVTLSCSLFLLLASSACEVVADFDPKKLETDRTIGPVPLPSLDGAVALIPDANFDTDGGPVIPNQQPDAEVTTPGDAGAPDAFVLPPTDLDAATEPDGEAGSAAPHDAAAETEPTFADAALE